MVVGLAASVFMPTATSAAPASSVFVNAGELLNVSNPYLCGGVAASTGTLDGTTCTAQFDPATGTLTLHNYNDDRIHTSVGDLNIILIGTNTIVSTEWYGILNNNGEDITISSSTNGSLAISVSSDGGTGTRGIYSSKGGTYGDITIKGNANIDIDVAVPTIDDYAATGIGGKNVNILENASVSVRAEACSTGTYYAFGLGAGDSDVTINTTGSVYLDASHQSSNSIAVYADNDFNLIKVNVLTMLFSGNGDGGNASDSVPTYNASLFDVEKTAGSEVYTYKLSLASADIPAMTVGTAITPVNVAVTDGVDPFTYSATGLPAGLSINSTTGVISGTPTTAGGAGTATITVTDNNGIARSTSIGYGAVAAAAGQSGDTGGGQTGGNTGGGQTGGNTGGGTTTPRDNNPRTGDINAGFIALTSILAVVGVMTAIIGIRKLGRR